MAKKKSSIIVNTLVLVIVTFVAIAALAVVNQITKEPIVQAELNARAEVYKTVYAEAASFDEVENTQQMLENAPEMLTNAGYDGCVIDDVLAVTDTNGDTAGYVIAASSPSGYGGNIQVAVGITKDGVIKGVDIVSHNETAGLGSKCTEPEFKSQFAGKTAAILEYSKTGASAENEIDAISGATITTNAVTEAVNAAIVFYQDSFAGGVKEKAENVTVDNAEETDNGYRITVTTKKGFAGDITLAVEIGKDSIINGFEILSSNETEGYGAKANEPDYAEQFVGLKADRITYSATGALKENNEVDAISGATYTTKAIDMAVNEAIKYYQENYGGGLSESFADENAQTSDAASSATPLSSCIRLRKRFCAQSKGTILFDIDMNPVISAKGE